jgi:hypothetical protein
VFDDPLVNTFGAIHSYCGLNNNRTVGESADALKTSIFNGLAHNGLCEVKYENDGAVLLDNLQSLHRAPDTASPNPSAIHGKETPDDVPESFHVVNKYRRKVVL